MSGAEASSVISMSVFYNVHAIFAIKMSVIKAKEAYS